MVHVEEAAEEAHHLSVACYCASKSIIRGPVAAGRVHGGKISANTLYCVWLTSDDLVQREAASHRRALRRITRPIEDEVGVEDGPRTRRHQVDAANGPFRLSRIAQVAHTLHLCECIIDDGRWRKWERHRWP